MKQLNGRQNRRNREIIRNIIMSIKNNSWIIIKIKVKHYLHTYTACVFFFCCCSVFLVSIRLSTFIFHVYAHRVCIHMDILLFSQQPLGTRSTSKQKATEKKRKSSSNRFFFSFWKNFLSLFRCACNEIHVLNYNRGKSSCVEQHYNFWYRYYCSHAYKFINKYICIYVSKCFDVLNRFFVWGNLCCKSQHM